MSERGSSSETPSSPAKKRPLRGEDAHLELDRKSAAGESLRLYVSETEPSPIERRTLIRWLLLALLALLLHLIAFWLAPHFSKPLPPPPVEVTQIDPAKLQAVKNKWKEKGFLLAKDDKPKEKAPEPKNARYESDRNRTVEKEMRARQTNVIPNQAGNPQGKSDREKSAQKKTPLKNLSLAQLSNFRNLPPPGPTREEQEAAHRRGGPGDTGDQALNDDQLPEGAENMLNTVESIYYSFYSRIYEQIGPLWQSHVRESLYRNKIGEGSFMTRAEVIFDSEGNCVDTRIVESSGHEFLDRAVIDSWKKIPRFPNPPRGLIQADGRIHMGWSFLVRIDQSLNWNYAPPARDY